MPDWIIVLIIIGLGALGGFVYGVISGIVRRIRYLRAQARRQRVILVDMDGVLADWDSAWDAAVLALPPGTGKGILLSHERQEFNLFHGLGEAERAQVTEIVERPGFYADLPIIEGAKQALRQMLRSGYDVRIVTSPWVSNPTCASDKMAWVIKNLGREWGQRLVITTDKTLVRGDWLIDDKPAIKGSMDPTWGHIWFTQPINMNRTGRRRIDAWGAWREIIEA